MDRELHMGRDVINFFNLFLVVCGWHVKKTRIPSFHLRLMHMSMPSFSCSTAYSIGLHLARNFRCVRVWSGLDCTDADIIQSSQENDCL